MNHLDSHLDDGLVHAWLDGEVDEAQDLRVQDHLESCSECAERLDLAARDRAAASELIEQLAPPVRLVEVVGHSAAETNPEDGHASPAGQARNAWLRPLAWAASMVLAMALGWFAHEPSPVVDAARPLAQEPVQAEQLATLDDAVATERRQESADDAAPEAALQAAPIRESSARSAPGGAASVRAAPRRSEAASISPTSVAAWLGREPILPSRSELLAARLLPATALTEGIGDGPIVELDLRLSDGRILRLWQQRLGQGIAAAGNAAEGRAAVIIDGVLVVAEGESAAQVLAALSALESR